jgi:hypothetical protein
MSRLNRLFNHILEAEDCCFPEYFLSPAKTCITIIAQKSFESTLLFSKYDGCGGTQRTVRTFPGAPPAK